MCFCGLGPRCTCVYECVWFFLWVCQCAFFGVCECHLWVWQKATPNNTHTGDTIEHRSLPIHWQRSIYIKLCVIVKDNLIVFCQYVLELVQISNPDAHSLHTNNIRRHTGNPAQFKRSKLNWTVYRPLPPLSSNHRNIVHTHVFKCTRGRSGMKPFELPNHFWAIISLNRRYGIKFCSTRLNSNQ